MKRKLIAGELLEVLNLYYIDPDDAENLSFIVGTRVRFTGDTTELPLHNDLYDTDDQEYERAYEVEFDIDDDGATARAYLFWDNFEVLLKKKREAPTTEVEWLDRVQANFRM